MVKLAPFAHRLASVAGSALILQFFSEYYFLNEGPAAALANAGSTPSGFMVFALFYGLFAYIFLIVLERFRVSSISGLFLAGAIFGWATEALVVQVVYDGPPITFFFPSVGWHAVVDVLIGWYLLRLAMRRLPLWTTAVVFALAGVGWGLWATWTWENTDSQAGVQALVYSNEQFTRIVLISSASWIAGMLLADWGMTREFRTSKLETALITVISLAMFIAMGMAFWPWMLALAALGGLTLAALGNARATGTGIITQAFSSPPRLLSYLTTPSLPATALLTYRLALKQHWGIPANDIVLLLLFGGGIFFFWTIWRLFTLR